MALRGTFGFIKKPTVFKKWHDKFSEVKDKVKNYEMPERFKGTFVERWGKYWRTVYTDYHDVTIDIAKSCKTRPIRASIYTSIAGGTVYLANHNPDETSFRETLLRNAMRIVPVGESIRNPTAVEHIKYMDECYNMNTVRRMNLGIFSLIWIDNYDSACAHYKATCKYLKPRYLTFHERIVDVGILDTWWNWESKMKDYDINEEEFKHRDV